MTDRHLAWDGCLNVRDLGGLPTVDGRRTSFGSIVRSDNPAYLSPEGWEALQAYGIRTIIALRTIGAEDDEPDEAALPEHVAFMRVVIEDGSDPDFVRQCADNFYFGTPIYFRLMLERWPELCAVGVAAVAAAEPGVVIACGRGCDRTGLMSFLLLALAGTTPSAIADDWALSVDRLRPRDPSFEGVLQGILDGAGTTVHDTIATTLREVDVEARLRVGGIGDFEIDAVRSRLLA